MKKNILQLLFLQKYVSTSKIMTEYKDKQYDLSLSTNICQGCVFCDQDTKVKGTDFKIGCSCPDDFPLDCGFYNIIIEKK